MKGDKYYFQVFQNGERSEYCNTLRTIRDEMKLERWESVRLSLAKREFGNGFFYCPIQGECFESGDSWNECGKLCPDYSPRNGKSGRCRNHENTFADTGIMFILNEEGLHEEKN